jgi:hypothetical protein
MHTSSVIFGRAALLIVGWMALAEGRIGDSLPCPAFAPGISGTPLLSSSGRAGVCSSNRRPSLPRAPAGCRIGAAARGGVVAARAAIDQAKIDKLVEKIASTPDAKSPGKLKKVLKKPSKAPTFSIEFARDPKIPHHKVETGSLEIRRAKVALLFVDTSVDADGPADVEAFIKEQATAKTDFPGSVPVIWRGNVRSVEDVARAAAAGCAGVSITFVEAGDKVEELIKAAFAVGIEPIVEVQEKAEVERAVAAGAAIVQVRFQSAAVESFKAFAATSLFKELPEDVLSLASVAGRMGGGEMSIAQQMMKVGYNSIVFTGMMTEDNQALQRYVKYIMAMMTSKRSSTIKINEAKAGNLGDISVPQGWGNPNTEVLNQ